MLKGALLLPYYAVLSSGFSKDKASGGAPDFLSGGTPEPLDDVLDDVLDDGQDDGLDDGQGDVLDDGQDDGQGDPLHSPRNRTRNRPQNRPLHGPQDEADTGSPALPLSGDALHNEFMPSRSSLGSASANSEGPSECGEDLLVGGQAVMEGVLMRNGASYALATRMADGTIAVERRHWYSFIPEGSFLKKPFIRGFSILVETLVNGVKALNRSAVLTSADEDELTDWQLTAMLFLSLLLALGMFIVVPHLLSLGMAALGLGGDMQGLSFHVWDGLFKFMVFIGYIAAIAMVPEIRRVFQYHGAEHKTIACFEHGGPVSVRAAARFSRLHPRCGTTFLLFVLSFAIILHAITVPLLLWIWEPQNSFLKHAGVLCFKIILMIPISALAYELIRFAAKLGSGFLGSALRAPGLLLQYLTTREPDEEQLEVAITALYEALNESQRATVHFEIPAYTVLE